MNRLGSTLYTTTNPHVYYKIASTDPDKSILNQDLILSNGIFFKNRETIKFSFEKSKESKEFNTCMIEKAFFLINGNYHYTNYPVVYQKDKANIVAALNSQKLKEKIEGKYSHLSKDPNQNIVMKIEHYQQKAKVILDQLIAKELTGVASSDIDHSQWISKNPLTSAMLACVKSNHDQVDIKATILERVIHFYSHKAPNEMNETFSLDGYIASYIDEIINYVFSPEGNKVTFSDNVAASIKEKVERMEREACNPTTKAEFKQVDNLMKELI